MNILLISDSGVATGFGRIADNLGIRLFQRGIQIIAASFAYDSLLPAVMELQRLPYHVASLQVKRATGQWVEDVVKLVYATKPDVVFVIQDAPYGEAVRNAAIDWSQHKFVMLTPVDGAPIEPAWVNLMKEADAAFTISQFGVDAFREAGVKVGLVRPAINPNIFYEYPLERKRELRRKMLLGEDAFIVGTMAQNQGRKAIPLMMEGFNTFAKDKPNAFYILDMDKTSPVGWHLTHLIEQNQWDRSKFIFREDCFRQGVTDLTDRYNLLDVHTVLAHREGYGLPLVEAMACGVVSIAMDYCSGTEIVGDGRGMLIPAIDRQLYSTWGGAMDAIPDVTAFIDALNLLYENPALRATKAQNGKTWARSQTWDTAADAIYETLMEWERPPQIPAIEVLPDVIPSPPPMKNPNGKTLQLSAENEAQGTLTSIIHVNASEGSD